MSALRRQQIEQDPSLVSAMAMSKRQDELLTGLAAALERIDALTRSVAILGRALGAMLEPEDRDRLGDALAALSPDETVERVLAAAERSERHGEEAVEAFLRQLHEKKTSEPWIPVRGSRKAQTGPHRSIPAGVTPVMADPDGKVWTQSGEHDYDGARIEAIAAAVEPPPPPGWGRRR